MLPTCKNSYNIDLSILTHIEITRTCIISIKLTKNMISVQEFNFIIFKYKGRFCEIWKLNNKISALTFYSININKFKENLMFNIE